MGLFILYPKKTRRSSRIITRSAFQKSGSRFAYQLRGCAPLPQQSVLGSLCTSLLGLGSQEIKIVHTSFMGGVEPSLASLRGLL